MNLGQNKKITLALIEEYSPTNIYLTDDEDIRDRLNLVYSPNYQYLSEEKPIIRTKTVTINKAGETEEINLPFDCRQLKRIVAMDSDGNKMTAQYDVIGTRIYLKSVIGKYIIEYFAYPATITEETADTFNLEIDQDAQARLTWLVANDILKVDPSANYTAFSTEFDKKQQRWDTRKVLPSAEIEEGDI